MHDFFLNSTIAQLTFALLLISHGVYLYFKAQNTMQSYTAYFVYLLGSIGSFILASLNIQQFIFLTFHIK